MTGDSSQFWLNISLGTLLAYCWFSHHFFLIISWLVVRDCPADQRYVLLPLLSTRRTIKGLLLDLWNSAGQELGINEWQQWALSWPKTFTLLGDEMGFLGLFIDPPIISLTTSQHNWGSSEPSPLGRIFTQVFCLGNISPKIKGNSQDVSAS